MLAWWLLACSDPPPSAEGADALRVRPPRELTVDCRGGADFAALVDAVAAARSGDLLTVAPCTYYGTVDLDGKALRVVSTGGPEVTTIAATPGRAVLVAHGGEGPRTVVSGFTLTGGGGPSSPGGVDVEMASLRLERSIVTGTRGTHAVNARSADLVLADVRIEGNTASEGTAVMALRGFLLLVGSTVTCDAELRGVQIDHGASLVDRSTVSCPGATSVYNLHSSGRLQRSTTQGMVRWEAEDASDTWTVETTVLGGGLYAEHGTLALLNAIVAGGPLELVDPGSGTLVQNTIFRATRTCAISGATTFMTVRNNAFFQVPDRFCGPDVGDARNVVVDCLHVDPAANDWRLSAGSPCIDAGAAASDPDVDGTRADLGVHGGPMTQSGGW